MIRHPPLSTLTDTLFPYTPLFRPTRERVLGAADGHIAHLGRRRSQIVLVPAGLHADERSVERLGRRRRANTRRQRKGGYGRYDTLHFQNSFGRAVVRPRAKASRLP